MAKVLEICVDSLASARAAIRGGADRIELCSALMAGGLTPFEMLLRQIREESDIRVRCLMRPRPGDFLYTPEELVLMRRQILQLKAAGADGFVIGCLTADGELDKEAMKPLVDACGGKGITLHGVSMCPGTRWRPSRRLGSWALTRCSPAAALPLPGWAGRPLGR